MQRITYLFISLLMTTALLLSACSNENTTAEVEAATKVLVTNEDVGFTLLQEAEPDAQGNTFLSPTSALFALFMTYNGAGGETKAEIKEALQIANFTEEDINEATKVLHETIEKNEDGLDVTLANSLWLNDDFSFLPSFETNMTDYFDAHTETIDIADAHSGDKINDWVKKETNGMIEEIVDPPLSQDTLTYLMNALYFNGTWTYEFDENATHDAPFYAEDDELELPFMSLEEELAYFETDELQAVKLPYNEGEMNMQIFLPKESESLDELIDSLTANRWETWQEKFEPDVEGTVLLPRFTLEYETTLNESLQQLGIKRAFQPGGADFSDMVEDTPPLHISEVKQKATIEVDEKGTEAAAATSVGIEMTSAPLEDDRFIMNINRPFFFAIYDEQLQHALFLGLVKKPVANE